MTLDMIGALKNCFRGAMLGLAVGDAVGTTLEFKRPGSFTPITDMVGGGPFSLNPGEWTDDTSMALCLASSLVECSGFNAKDQMERYVRWWKEGYFAATGRCVDIGITVTVALSQFIDYGDPYSGSTEPNTAGNGSLMRLAPVALFYSRNPQMAIMRSADSSRTTHGAQSAVDACRYFSGLLVGALHGESKDVILSCRYSPSSGPWAESELHNAIECIASGSFKKKQPPEIRGTGYVVDALEAALWAFYTTDSFRDGCLKAANLGGDADTTAAIYGQIAGAYYGADMIPAEWQERLAMRETIIDLADRLFDGSLAQK